MSKTKKPKQIPHVVLYPSREGWTLAANVPGSEKKSFPTLEEAAAHMSSGGRITVALRTSRVLYGRFSLPSTEPGEVESMAELQLEKTLPYPIEETATESRIISTDETSAISVSQVVRSAAVEEEFNALTARGVLPDELILFPSAVAATGPSTGTVVSFFAEGPDVAMVISENGKVSFAQTLVGTENTAWDSNIAQWMFAAEIAGISLRDAPIRLEQGLDVLELPISAGFGKTPERFTIAPPFNTPAAAKLTPYSWEQGRAQRRRKGLLRKQLALVVGAYLALIIGVVIFLVVLRLRVNNVEKQVAQVLPLTQHIQKSTTLWESLAPAVDYRRQPLEVLLRLYDSRPSDDLLITNFDHTAPPDGPGNIVVRGEAPSLEQAYQFVESLKAQENFPYRLENEQPAPAGEKFQFQISGGSL